LDYRPVIVMRMFTLLVLVSLWVAVPVSAADDPDVSFASVLAPLNTRDFEAKSRAIAAISELKHERAGIVLQALLDGSLSSAKSTKRIVLVREIETGYEVEDAVTAAPLGMLKRTELKRVSVNNKLRRQLRELIAHRALGANDPVARRKAVEAMTDALDATGRALLIKLRSTESDDDVLHAVDIALAIADLESSSTEERNDAIDTLHGSLNPLARGRLAALVAADDTADDTRRAAASALTAIEQRVAFFEFLQVIFFGLSLGSVLVLAAIGLAITFGVMGVINMAHGELIMLGAYTTYVVQLLMPQHIDWSLLVAVPAAFMVAALVGIAIERGVIRFLYGRPLETLLATFGVSLVLQQAVRSIFSPLNRSVSTPSWMSGSIEINSVLSLTYNRLTIIIFTLVVFAALMAVLRYSRLGLEVRAVAQNRAMARAVGVRGSWVDAMTFGLGAGVAGVAGVALSQLTNVGPNLGQAYIVDSFMVVVFGGVGNLWGTLIAGMGLGVANKFLEPSAGAVMAKIVVLVFIIVFIQKRPRGMFPQRGRAVEN
jgi:urea transport system permease protein